MYPILISFGPITIYSLSIFLLLSWVIFSFLFWRYLRSQAVSEEKIFDLTFYATLAALVFGRLVFVLEHPADFAASILLIPTIWVAPGLSFYGGLIAGIVTLLVLSKRYGVRMAYVLDACAASFPLAFMFGAFGSLLDGSEVGSIAELPWSVYYVGYEGLRHPVQIYEILMLLFTLFIVIHMNFQAQKKRHPHGMVGAWFFFLFASSMFGLEYLKDRTVYFLSLSFNQWVLLGIFAESAGAVYVRGGIKERVKPIIKKLQGGIYGSLSRRSSRKPAKETHAGTEANGKRT